jgi:hypothetical protein
MVAGAILSSILMVHIPVVQADSINSGIYAIDSKPFGHTYGDWSARYWQWVTLIPKNVNPNLDKTGENCKIGQVGPVWNLALTFGGAAERTCTIPAGKAIFVPILTGECDYLTTPAAKTESDLLKCAAGGNENGIMEATIDGVKVQDINKYRAQSPLFNLTIPDNNVFGNPTGTSQAKADGFYVFLTPLSPGRHEAHFSGSVVDNPITGTQSYSTDVTYHLIVKK